MFLVLSSTVLFFRFCTLVVSCFSRNGKPGFNQIPAALLRAVERPHGLRLEFSGGGIPGPVRVTVSRAEYENQRENRDWVIQFPADALRVL